MLQIENLPGGSIYKIYNMTTCYVYTKRLTLLDEKIEVLCVVEVDPITF